MELIDEGMCFICGKRNPIGLRVEFDTDRENLRISGVFTPRREHEGYKGILHGGLVAALLDEAMVKLLWEAGIPAVSASLDIRLARPAMVGEPLHIKGWVDSQKGKLVLTGARAEDSGGRIVAEARGRCMKIDVKEAERVKPDQAKGSTSAL
jgi:acyl-coenzyme A thioesterase PaaI-like protein